MAATSKVWRSIYRLRLLTGLFLAAPTLGLGIWYGWSAYAELDRYRRAYKPKAEIDLELYQIALYDTLRRDVRRMLLPDRPADSKLPTYELSLTRAQLDALSTGGGGDRVDGDSDGDGDGDGDGDDNDYLKGHLRKDGNVHDVGVRLRGSRFWNRLPPQKSLKIRVDKGDLVDGTRTFNLINDVTPFGMEDQLILDLAREMGLLTPEYRPVWLRINNVDMGVYRYVVQPTEGLLRRAGRMPGSIFSGDTTEVDPGLGVGDLFFSTRGWKQVSQREMQQEQTLVELERLLDGLRESSFAQFAELARRELDLERFARFDALDVVFGGDQHDYMSNHKLYYDAYTGRFEPIAWNFRGFKHEEQLNLVDPPLLVRLKMTPDYLALRDGIVYGLLIDQASVPSLRARADAAFDQMAPDLAADPYWDAYKLLPRASGLTRFMVRPMTAERWLMRSQDELAQYGRRNRWLLGELERSSLEVTGGIVAGESVAGESHHDGPSTVRVDVVASHHAAYDLRGVTVTTAGECGEPLRWVADADRDGRYDPERDPVVGEGVAGGHIGLRAYRRLAAGVVLEPRDDADPKRGNVRVLRRPRTYHYFLLSGGCAPEAIALEVESLVTGASTLERVDVNGPAPAPEPPEPSPDVDVVPGWEAGLRSPHPWSYPPRTLPSSITLGPGVVTIDHDRIFAEHETVTIAAGTRISMQEGVSLVFLGAVHATGTAGAPIEIAPRDPRTTFGGVALQGPGTAGSTLRHVQIWGATSPRYLGIHYTGALNVYDTSDITLESVELIGAAGGDELLHATYVHGLRAYEVTARRAPADAIDLEHVRVEVRGLRVLAAGDDCVDLRGTTGRFLDSAMIGCPDNAISAGEDTHITARSVLIARSGVGILSKNASDVRITKSLLYRNQEALRTKHEEVHHAGGSSIGAQDIYAVLCDKVSRSDRATRLDAGNVLDDLPIEGALDHLRGDVLGLNSWQDLEPMVMDLGGPAPEAPQGLGPAGRTGVSP